MNKLSSPWWVYLIQAIVLVISMLFLSACEVNEDEAKRQAVALGNKLIQAVKSPEAQQIFEKSQRSLNGLLDKVGDGVSEVSKEAIVQILRELDQEINVKMPEIAPIITPIINDEIKNFFNELQSLGDPPDNIIEQYIYQAAESAARAAIVATVNELSLDLTQSEIDQVARFVARVAAHKVFLSILENNPEVRLVMIVQRVMTGFNGERFEQLVAQTLAALSAPPGSNLAINKTAIVNTDGNIPLRCRVTPGLNSEIIVRLNRGRAVILHEGPIPQDGFEWWRVELADKQQCWVAGDWLLAQ